MAKAKGAAKAKAAATAPANVGEPLVRGRLADVGAILSGVLYFVAFAGFDQWWLTFVCLVPLYVSLTGQTTKRSVWLCFLTGLAMNLGGFYWLTNMLKTFSGFPIYLCVFFVIFICSYQALRLAFMGWLYGRASQRGWPLPLVFAGSFAVSELVFPLLFPWYYAATVHNVPVLMQTAELGGPILVGLVLVTVNMAIAEPLRARLSASRELVPIAPTAYRGSTRASSPSRSRWSSAPRASRWLRAPSRRPSPSASGTCRATWASWRSASSPVRACGAT